MIISVLLKILKYISDDVVNIARGFFYLVQRLRMNFVKKYSYHYYGDWRFNFYVNFPLLIIDDVHCIFISWKIAIWTSILKLM